MTPSPDETLRLAREIVATQNHGLACEFPEGCSCGLSREQTLARALLAASEDGARAAQLRELLAHDVVFFSPHEPYPICLGLNDVFGYAVADAEVVADGEVSALHAIWSRWPDRKYGVEAWACIKRGHGIHVAPGDAKGEAFRAAIEARIPDVRALLTALQAAAGRAGT